MIESTVNELSKYAMKDHKNDKNQQTDINVMDIISISKKTFHEEQSILEAAKVLVKEQSTGYPVVNKKGEVVGFLSEKDCLGHIYDDFMTNTPTGKVCDYMAKDVMTFSTTTSIYKIIECFITHPYHVYPVVDNGKYIGEVRRKQMLKTLLKRGYKL